MDILTYMERAADQCSSIAMMMLSKHNDEILQNHHHYLQVLHESGEQNYVAEQAMRKEQFLDPIARIGVQ